MVRGIFIWIILFYFTALANGQMRSKTDRILSDALSAYHNGDYTRAAKMSEKILKNDPDHLMASLLMADIYHDLDSTTSEIIWLKKAAGIKDSPVLVYYRLGEALYNSGNFREALDKLQSIKPDELNSLLREKTTRLLKKCTFAVQAMAEPVVFSPENAGPAINSIYDDYWPSLTVDGNTLVFTRLLPVADNRLMKQEDFYISRLDTSGYGMAEPLTELNSPLNEGAQSISADGRLLFFTLCNHPEGWGSCDIWISKFENGKWSLPLNAGQPVNTSGWEGQPSFSAFGDALYLSSSRPGGKGKKDIWKVTLKGWSRAGYPLWDEPANLGDSINSSGDEISPFIHPNGNDLFFSSDFWPGFGGLDLFHAEKKGDNGWTMAENLGYPINSPGNEQGLVIDRTGKMAWFATSLTRKGHMDIFRFETDERFRPAPVTYVRGKVINAKTGHPVRAFVDIAGIDPLKPLDIRTRTDENGIFLITLPPEQDVSFTVNEKGYLFYSEIFNLSGNSSAVEPPERQLALVPAEPGKSINLYNILFETNAYQILPESEPELLTLLNFLQENHSLKVEIGGHTDNTGTAEFNQQLSERRAHSVKQYLLEKGIESGRLSSKGYGMEQPVAPNNSEEGRSKNRRTTIKVLE